MDAFVKIVQALSTLLWPLIVIAVIILFRPAVSALIESAKSRKFTIKIGGQELSMDEADEQQRSLIADLQAQFADLRKRLEPAEPQQEVGAHPQVQLSTDSASSVLWVDDEPKNNAYFIEALERAGVRVDLARNTAQGLSMFGRRRYSVVISDMGRREDGKENFTAGLDLLKAVRERDKRVPFIIFCSTRGVAAHAKEAYQLGANGITSSASELYGLLNLEEMRNG